MKSLFAWVRHGLADRRVHEFLWFSVPGTLVALAVRAWLMWSLPYGLYHPDTHDFTTSIYYLEANHRWLVHGKVTFLAPLLYCLAFLVPKIPALIVIPFAQHLRGLLLVFLVGLLARLWFDWWRWLIIPLTVLAALDPAMLYWEHALMSESGFVFGAVALALGGTVFVLCPGWPSLGLLLSGMFLVAAARPEGNLWQGAGVLVVLLVRLPDWRQHWIQIAAPIVLAAGMLTITKTSHSGLLLYSSLVHLTPDDPRTIPGFGPYIVPLRDRKLADRQTEVVDDVVRASRGVIQALADYARDHPHADLGLPAPAHKPAAHPVAADPSSAEVAEPNETEAELKLGNNVSNLCRRLAIECARAHPFALPGYALRKFLAPINEDPGGQIDDVLYGPKQAFSLWSNGRIVTTIGRGLTGVAINSPEDAAAFVRQHYDLSRATWFNALEAAWYEGVDRFHLPSIAYSPVYRLPGLPIYYLLAFLGMAAALWHPARLRRFQWAFVAVLLGSGAIVMLTAAVIPRHRFVYEPFWMLYGFLLIDAILAVLWALVRRMKPPAAAPPPAVIPPAPIPFKP